MSKVSELEAKAPETVEKVIEKRVEVDNPEHLSRISKLEKDNAELNANATDYQNQIEKLKKENQYLEGLQEKLTDLENDESKQLALISRLEKENKELADLKAQQARFDAQEEKVAKLEKENKELADLKAQQAKFAAQEEKIARLEAENTKLADLQSDLSRLQNENAQHLSLIGKIEQEKSQTEEEKNKATQKLADLEGKLTSLKRGASLDLVAAKAAGIEIRDENDLTAIEGIGPKIKELLQSNGIKSLKDLSEADTTDIQNILNKGGTKFQMANPSTWADQASLACNNRWAALKSLQDVLDGGVYPDASKTTANSSSDSAKIQQLQAELKKYQDKEQRSQSAASVADVDKAKAAGFMMRLKGNQDDFTVIEGIGPKINELIHAEGIHTFAALASTEQSVIQSILDKAGPSFALADPGTWSAQSELAANNEWEKLKKWQDELDGGKS